MRSSVNALLPLAAVALSGWTASCNSPPSVLLVEVAGDVNLAPAALSVAVTAARTSGRTFYIAPAGGVVSLPASFTVELPTTIVGPITVAITAVDSAGTALAAGTATRQNLDVGGQTILVVTLVDAATIDEMTPDAGAPGGVDGHAGADARTVVDGGADGRRPADGGGQ